MKVIKLLLIFLSLDVHSVSQKCFVDLDKLIFKNIDLTRPLPKNLKKVLKSRSINRQNIFLNKELENNFNTNIVNIKIKELKLTKKKNIQGSIFDTNVVSIKAHKNISTQHSLSLLENLGEFGNEVQNSLNQDILLRLYQNNDVPKKISNTLYNLYLAESFVTEISRKFYLSKESKNYFKYVINEVRKSGQLALNEKGLDRRKISTIRLRWKTNDITYDFDTLHRDAIASYTSSLTLVGSGTELFEIDNNKLSIIPTKSNIITHFKNRPLEDAVLHRASTSDYDKRLVMIIFWE